MKTQCPFAQARDLYRQRLHPRVLMGPDDLARIAKAVRSPRGQAPALMAALRKIVGPVVDSTLACDDLPKLLNDPGNNHVAAGDLIGRAQDVALVAHIDDDANALAAIVALFKALPQVPPSSNYDILVHGRIAPALLAFDLVHDRLDPQVRAEFSAWTLQTQVVDIANARRRSYLKQSGMNLAFGKVISAVVAILAMRDEPGAEPAAALLPELCHFLEASLNTAVCPDGYPEEDTGYGTDFTTLLFRAVEALRRSGDFDLLDRCPHFALFPRAILHFMQPWGESLVTTGDAGDHFHGRHQILPRLGRIAGDPVAPWLSGVLRREAAAMEIAPARAGFPAFQTPIDTFSLLYLGDMAKGQTPAAAKRPTAFCDRRRGIVSFRSGWKPDDTLLVLDGSQRCSSAQGHFHASAGHFSLSALGERFAIDTGRYNMDQDQHNVVLIDGRSGRSSDGQWIQAFHHGRLTDYRPGPFCDFASVDSSLQHNCFWAFRSAILVKGSRAPAYAWIIDDLNKANDFAEFWWTLNTSPEQTIDLRDGRATLTGCRLGNHLDVHFVIPPPHAYAKPHTLELAQDVATCGSWRYIGDAHAAAAKIQPPRDQVHHSVYVRPRLIAKVAGYNGRFMSLLLPRRKGDAPARVESLPTLDNAFAARITFDTVEDTLIWAFDHRLLEAGGLRARGDWCVVRRDRRTGRILQAHVQSGALLRDGPTPKPKPKSRRR